MNDYYELGGAVDSVTLPLNTARKLLTNDDGAHFLSENNEDFLEESGLKRRVQVIDDCVKPPFTLISKHDIMMASPGAVTPLRYHTNYRHFVAVTSGKLKVKMTPWRSTKYLHPIKDYENYEFYSPIRARNTQHEHLKDYEKIRFLDFEVLPGYVLYIPPFWWYSLQFEEGAVAYNVSYITTMNYIVNLPQFSLYWLQQRNIRKKVSKIPQVTANKPDSEPKKETVTPVETETTVTEQKSQDIA